MVFVFSQEKREKLREREKKRFLIFSSLARSKQQREVLFLRHESSKVSSVCLSVVSAKKNNKTHT